VRVLHRRETAIQALKNSFIMRVSTLEEACSFSNEYAPEHLIINVEYPDAYISKVVNAGSIFCGPWTPESVGDYASGTNHVLPTYGYAKMYEGVSSSAFMKGITVQTLTREGLENLGPHVVMMASVEGLQAHGNAVSLRLDSH